MTMLLSKGSILLLAATAIGVAVQPMRPILVQGGSMFPTYADGALLWTTPVDRPLARGDVVIADTPEGRIIKRVALLPGDRRFQFKTPGGWIDLTMSRPVLSPWKRKRLRFRELVVPAETVFLLGDNLDGSDDSRTFGPVPLTDVRRLVIDQRPPDDRSGVQRIPAREWLDRATVPGTKT